MWEGGAVRAAGEVDKQNRARHHRWTKSFLAESGQEPTGGSGNICLGGNRNSPGNAQLLCGTALGFNGGYYPASPTTKKHN